MIQVAQAPRYLMKVVNTRLRGSKEIELAQPWLRHCRSRCRVRPRRNVGCSFGVVFFVIRSDDERASGKRDTAPEFVPLAWWRIL